MSRPFLILAFVAAGLAALRADEPTSALTLYGKPTLEILRKPDHVEVCLLTQHQDDSLTERTPRSTVHPSMQRALSAILTKDKTYLWDVRKACLVNYEARAIFHRGEQIVTVDFCFGCDILAFESPFQKGGAHFDGGARPLRVIFEKLFPENKLGE